MRLFAALDLSEEASEELALWWQQAGLQLHASEWRFVPRENWHLTLAFYGEITGGEAERLADALSERLPGFQPLLLRLKGSGVFPSLARPRVIWAGVEDARPPGSLAQLARCCRLAGHATLRKRGAKEDPFRGHVTLARARGLVSPLRPEMWQDFPPLPDVTWLADTVRLYQSVLRPEGAQYRCIEEFRLKE